MVESVARNTQRGATVLHHRSSLWYMVLVEGRRRDLTLIDPFCTSWDRHTDVVWPDPISAAQATPDTGQGIPQGSARRARPRKTVPVYVLAQKKIEIDRFREAGFEVIPVGEDRFLYELVPQRGR
jgi:hypothetical protein